MENKTVIVRKKKKWRKGGQEARSLDGKENRQTRTPTWEPWVTPWSCMQCQAQ